MTTIEVKGDRITVSGDSLPELMLAMAAECDRAELGVRIALAVHIPSIRDMTKRIGIDRPKSVS